MKSQTIPQTGSDFDTTRIVERPDGFYWQSTTDGRESGPFATLVEAVEQMRVQEDGGFEPGESLEEAEAEIGIAEWRDPDTGELAEEGVPRVEDH
jgi:hypothetical protein